MEDGPSVGPFSGFRNFHGMALSNFDIDVISFDEYAALGLSPTNVFGSYPFMELNRLKARDVACVVNKERSVGIVFGCREDVYLAPWSAPYLSLNVSDRCSAEDARTFGRNVGKYLEDKRYRLVFPPEIYDGPESVFLDGFRHNACESLTDTSFYIPLASSEGEKTWNKSARRNLKKGINEGLVAAITNNPAECYSLIARHHESMGYNMAMTEKQVLDTSKIIPVDFWIVRNGDVPVAAMYCYRVRHDIVQVIASGDTSEGRKCGAAIFLERAMIDHYRKTLVEEEGISGAVLDHGPTSVRGVQNEGLAAFKSSFGCVVSPKYTLYSS